MIGGYSDMETKHIWWALSAFILVGALWAGNVKAETNLYAGAWSKHIFSEGLNEEHGLIGIEHNKWMAARFTNSYNRESYAVARKFDWSAHGIHTGVYVGAVRGYTTCFGDDDSNTNTCPMAVPYITYDAVVAPQVMLFGEAVAISFRIRL